MKRLLRRAKSFLIVLKPFSIVVVMLAVFLLLSLREGSLFRRYEGAVSAFSLLLAMLAIVFALDAKAGTNRVLESISTRYVGQFPQNLQYLTGLVRKSTYSFSAYADCVDYGSFFEPLKFENFLTAVEKGGCPRRQIYIFGDW